MRCQNKLLLVRLPFAYDEPAERKRTREKQIERDKNLNCPIYFVHVNWRAVKTLFCAAAAAGSPGCRQHQEGQSIFVVTAAAAVTAIATVAAEMATERRRENQPR